MRTISVVQAAAASTVMLVAGAAWGLQPEDRGARPATISADRNPGELRSCTWLNGRDVVNTSGEDIAEVSDVILDRGSGRIEHAILTTGAILGMGGRQVAVPFRELRWDPAADKLTLAMTKEQLEQLPEFSEDAWAGLRKPEGLSDRLGAWLTGEDVDERTDPYATAFEGAKHEHIEGEIVSVNRTRGGNGEQMEVEIKTNSGETRRVSLGPSWFLSGGANPPMRGDKVVVDAVQVPRDANGLWVANSIRTGDRDFTLRESGGAPMWSMKSAKSDGQDYSTPYWRYVLLSDVRGQRVDCRGQECGKVDDVVLASRSGEIAFLSIDPNENFLGIGDTKRLVPWSVATVGLDGTIRLDASKEMVLASPETPSDFTSGASTISDRVYRAYDVPQPRYMDRDQARSDMRQDGRAAWAKGGGILGSWSTAGSPRTIDGKVVEMTEVHLGDGGSARAVKISTSSGEETVLVGPAWYMDNQELMYRPGDPIKLKARRITVDGKEHLVAGSIDHNGRSTTLIDDDGRPVWDRR